jgi:LacI family transcriptional regulator
MSVAEQTRHVALLVESSNAYGRGLLAGVRKYVAVRPEWSLYVAEHSRQETDLSWLEGWRGHGVLARIETPETARFIRRLDLPTVDLSAGRLVPGLPGVETDDKTIARWALEHFAERGLQEFGYVGDERFGWSVNRGHWLSEYVRSRGKQLHAFAMQPSGMRALDRQVLGNWVRQLPKPIGVLACYDIAGQELLEACKLADAPVPDAVAVLGVDNDEFIGALTSPPLSSIEPDSVRTGYLAAEMLDQMMAGVTLASEQRFIEPLRLVPRQSSDVLAVSDQLLAKALTFIRENSYRSCQVTEVMRHVGLSRRALDYRFVGALGRTTHAEIIRVRVERVRELLSSTDLTLHQIAERLDFSHSEYMGVRVKPHTGKSPGVYRRALIR